MGSLARKAIGGSIHKIREFELEKVSLAEEFDILQIVGEGWFGKILLVEHKATDTEMVLKALPKPYTALRDFYREFHYGLHLGAHRNIITTYDVAFETAGFYVFSQEYAPLGDLTSNVSETGIGELHTKRVARQLAAALEHLHSRDLVHRDVKLDNILVFKSDFSRVKLCDFGETRRSGSVVRRHNEWLPYAPPEVLITANDDMYKAVTSHDVWQFAIVVFVCLTGCLPWQKAALDDPRYSRFVSWHCSSIPIRRQPKLFKLISSKAQRLFRKFLEPKTEKRPATLSDVHRFLDDRWLAKNSSEKNNGLSTEDDGLCPSMYSYHSSPEEKNKLLHSLTQYGIEACVDRCVKKDRIRAWIENSIIEEEDEDAAEEDSEDEETTAIIDNETGPIGERMNRGPVEDKRQQVVKDSARLERQKRRERRYSAISRRASTVYTPPIDPRIPLESQRLSQSEVNLNRNFVFPSESYVDKDAITQDDSTISYTESHSDSQTEMKHADIKHALPLQNLAEINGDSQNKDSSPPKQNESSQSTLPLSQNDYSRSQSVSSLKQNDLQTSSLLKQNDYPNSQSILSSKQNDYLQSQSTSLKQNDNHSQSTSSLKQNDYVSSPLKQNDYSHSQSTSHLKQNDYSYSQNTSSYFQSTSSLKQNGYSQSQSTSSLKENGYHYDQQKTSSQQNQPMLQSKPQQSSVKADLVENRRSSSSSRYNHRKMPMKQRYEAYGSFEEKNNTSNSTGRSISK